MKFSGFSKEDFEVFNIEGFNPRMEALKTHIRPKLEYLGQHFAPTLATLTGEDIYPHVAKHARRTVNPPKDTWVAFAGNSRGYKMLPHFQIGMWETHLFVWYAVIYEAPRKTEIAERFLSNLSSIKQLIPSNYVWSNDHTKPDAIPHSAIGPDGFTDLFNRLKTVKKAEVLCGKHFSKDEVISMSSDLLIEEIDATLRTLLPLYKLS